MEGMELASRSTVTGTLTAAMAKNAVEKLTRRATNPMTPLEAADRSTMSFTTKARTGHSALRIRLFTTSITVSPLPDCHKIRNISPVPFDSAIIFFIPVPSSFDADLIAVLSFSRPDISYFITIFIL